MSRIKYFFDTEFIEQPGRLVPVSIGMVCEDGRELHLVSNEFDPRLANAWVVKNVLQRLPPEKTWKSREAIANELKAFVDAGLTGDNPNERARPQFWAYFASYDWVCLCWLMRCCMIDLPSNWPHFCMDLKQSMAERGMNESFLPAKDAQLQHDALEDARWLKRAHEAVFG